MDGISRSASFNAMSGLHAAAGAAPDPAGEQPEGPGAATFIAHTKRSPLETLPAELRKLVATHLTIEEFIALGLASKTLQAQTQILRGDPELIAGWVRDLLDKPHAERKLIDLVRIGLLPRSALAGPFSKEKEAVLRTGNVITGLHLNHKMRVRVRLHSYDHAPSDRMPAVVNGIAKLTDSPWAILDEENNTIICLKNGDRVTILSELLKSNVFANALCPEYGSLFHQYLISLREDQIHQRPIDLRVARQWARAVHPDILQIPAARPRGVLSLYWGQPCTFAAVVSHPEIVEILIRNGADFNIATSDGTTPLHHVTRNGHKHARAIISALIRNGVDVNHADLRGKTALHMAAAWGRESLVRLLIRHGAEGDAVDDHGRNALHSLLISGMLFNSESACIEVVPHLIRAGASPFTRDYRGKRPMDYLEERAQTHSCDELVKVVAAAM